MMQILSKKEIIAAIEKNENDGGFRIRHGSPTRAKIASYNPIIGQAFSYKKGEISIGRANCVIEIEPNESIALKSEEEFALENDQFGICFSRVLNAHQSIAIDTTFIDPGYRGNLHCVLRNFGETKCSINLRTFPIMKVVLFRLSGLDLQKESNPDAGIGKEIAERHRIIKESEKKKRRILIGCAALALLLPCVVLFLVATAFPNAFNGNGLLQSITTVLCIGISQIFLYLAVRK